MFFIASCADKKSEQKPETVQEEVAVEESYQCPMDCEEGKTYHKAGSCPVCKMDLKAVSSTKSQTCKQHKDGKCTCEGEKCACANCKQHT